MTTEAVDARSVALDAYIAQRGAQGFRVETRSGLQAVIGGGIPCVSYCVGSRGDWAEQRLVVSVDEHCEVATLAAQPRRW